MRKKPFLLWTLLLLLALTLGGCGQQPAPQEPAEVRAAEGGPEDEQTPTPGTAIQTDGLTPDIQPVVSDTMIEQRVVTLYYRMQSENMLAAETRTLFFPKDKQDERVLIEALINGPSPNLLDLNGLFPAGTKLFKTWRSEDLLTVVLTRDFLQTPTGAPVAWENDPIWRSEVYLRRQLALTAIVNTVTEHMSFTSIQFLVQGNEADETGRRLRLSEVYENGSYDSYLPPMLHDESAVLTHYNTAQILMSCWQSQTFARMFTFVSPSATRPTDATFQREMQSINRTLVDYTISAGTVSKNGSLATLEVTYQYIAGQETLHVQSFPLQLMREDGLWKIQYEELRRLMEAL